MPTKRSPRGLKRKIKEEKENLDEVDIKNDSNEFDSDDELAEYEQRRLQNIADRKNKIDELKITDISLELAAGIDQENKAKAISRRGLSALPRQREVLPPRAKSLRLQNIRADTSLQLPEKEPTNYQVYSEREEIPRLPLEDLSLEELCNNNEDCETTSNYFDTKVIPFIGEDKKTKLATSIFDNVGTLGKNLKKLKITVCFTLFLSYFFRIQISNFSFVQSHILSSLDRNHRVCSFHEFERKKPKINTPSLFEGGPPLFLIHTYIRSIPF